MNILPKKRWHVRTKDNIARVRRDEAEAREKEENRLKKLKFAESEARLNFLRKQSGLPERHNNANTEVTTATVQSNNAEHFDLFADYKAHVKTSNKELETEQKEEREKYEKQIGYLTYLGQDTNEALKQQSWYEKAPKRSEGSTDEKDLRAKFAHDPLNLINALLPKDKTSTKSKHESPSRSVPSVSCTVGDYSRTNDISKHHKRKKQKKSKSHKKEKRQVRNAKTEIKQQQKRLLIEQLRKERLKREETERARQDELLNPRETNEVITAEKAAKVAAPRIVQKYNSQFNPELAKQNIS